MTKSKIGPTDCSYKIAVPKDRIHVGRLLDEPILPSTVSYEEQFCGRVDTVYCHEGWRCPEHKGKCDGR